MLLFQAEFEYRYIKVAQAIIFFWFKFFQTSLIFICRDAVLITII